MERILTPIGRLVERIRGGVSFRRDNRPIRDSAGEAVGFLSRQVKDGRKSLSETPWRQVWQKSMLLAVALWGKTSRRMRLLTLLFIFLMFCGWLLHLAMLAALVKLPSIVVEYPEQYHYNQQSSKFNHSKVALLIENRPNPILAPLMLHFMGVVPPDWRFRFMGSLESVRQIKRSAAIRQQVAAGKLDLTYIPSNMTTGSQEEISRFLTTLWLYDTVLQPAEWLLIFQTDSILCANSRRNLNDYLEYDWVGAPWSLNSRYGGNGGLSLRRVSAIIEVLREQKRVDGSDPEDVWLSERLGHRKGAKMANGTISSEFSGEQYSGGKVDIHKPPPKGEAIGEGGIGGGSTFAPGIAPPSNGTFQANNETENAAPEPEPEKVYTPGVDDWRHGFYEPMGYHTGGSGKYLHSQVWGTPEMRKHIWDYCPEVKMTLAMDAAKFVPGSCGGKWKRTLEDWRTGDEEGEEGHWEVKEEGEEGAFEMEVIDGVEYPLLRGLRPW
ncbi:hypothetical protein QBC35DRAFT_449696 [Podospora australis]|uniref:DUF5672 domain-containing protein n=1 Tax=Podospora australis TaxID=1536484 RepID=A0AAN6WZF6_9PEZI|nr:hypothetical protein QBC35DRAFT_449696 [Podospora australis]